MDIHLVNTIIANQFPELVIVNTALIPEGGDSYTFDINGNIIFKFPISSESEKRLLNEYHSLLYLSQKLPGYVAKPIYYGEPSSLFPYSFTGQQKLGGESGEKRRACPQDWAEMAKTAGNIFSQLHISHAGELAFQNLPQLSLESPLDKLNQVILYKKLLQHVNDPNDAIQPYLNGTAGLPSASRLAPVLSHGDVKGEHILVSRYAFEITGIVDWADICLADPIVDFSGFVIWLGPGFAKDILDYYQPQVDDHFLARAVFYARCSTLIHLGESLAGRSDAPRQLLLNQLAAAFSS
ncbi:phosphotransferase family protein [Paenibacillus solisilvae]|uniref:Phosphotransferase family protein n=1 Tax=Paenibacillus solisilvae TaxID=2486751 RepID=A0ABW0W7A5_9BACL